MGELGHRRIALSVLALSGTRLSTTKSHIREITFTHTKWVSSPAQNGPRPPPPQLLPRQTAASPPPPQSTTSPTLQPTPHTTTAHLPPSPPYKRPPPASPSQR